MAVRIGKDAKMEYEEDIERWLGLNRRLEAQIMMMRGVLTEARHTIELLNDVLKRKGDGSLDDWATHMLIQIDRTLNPGYFANAPAVPPDNGG